MDLILTHGISRPSVYVSVWGVFNCINRHHRLNFKFPSHDKQKEIFEDFMEMSGASFNCMISAIDGMLVWTVKPSKNVVKQQNVARRTSCVHEMTSLV